MKESTNESTVVEFMYVRDDVEQYFFSIHVNEGAITATQWEDPVDLYFEMKSGHTFSISLAGDPVPKLFEEQQVA